MFLLLMLSMQISLQTPQESIPLKVQVPQTMTERQIGLSRNSDLSKDSGMLFVMPNLAHHPFTMRETHIPLTLLFFDENMKLVDAQTKRAFEKDLVIPKSPAKYVLEVNPQLFKSHSFPRNQTFLNLNP